MKIVEIIHCGLVYYTPYIPSSVQVIKYFTFQKKQLLLITDKIYYEQNFFFFFFIGFLLSLLII